MSERARLVLVVPCYNEASRLAVSEFEAFLRARRDAALVLVDDGSTDGTGAVLDGIRRSCPDRVVVLSLERNAGKAEAVRRGMLAALDRGPALAGYWDADLATPLDAVTDFERVAELAPDVDILLGSRVQLMGRCVERAPLRHYVGRIFATIASRILDLPVYDTQCGAKLFRVTGELPRIFGEPFLTRWTFDVEVLARYLARCGTSGPRERGAGIYEVALREWRDRGGTKLPLGRALGAPIDLFRIWIHYR